MEDRREHHLRSPRREFRLGRAPPARAARPGRRLPLRPQPRARTTSTPARDTTAAPTGAPPPPPTGGGLDFSALFVLLDAVRRAAPAELQERITTLIREALLTLRSLIDWYLERLDRRPRETRVEDIPID